MSEVKLSVVVMSAVNGDKNAIDKNLVVEMQEDEVKVTEIFFFFMFLTLFSQYALFVPSPEIKHGGDRGEIWDTHVT